MNLLLARSSFNTHKVLFGIEAGITAFCLLLAAAFTVGFALHGRAFVSGELFFMVLVLVAGALTGSEFPLVNALLIGAGFSPGRSAGVADGFDHLGACMGGALSGTFLVPLLGIAQASLFIAMLNLLSCMFIGLFLIKKKEPGLYWCDGTPSWREYRMPG